MQSVLSSFGQCKKLEVGRISKNVAGVLSSFPNELACQGERGLLGLASPLNFTSFGFPHSWPPCRVPSNFHIGNRVFSGTGNHWPPKSPNPDGSSQMAAGGRLDARYQATPYRDDMFQDAERSWRLIRLCLLASKEIGAAWPSNTGLHQLAPKQKVQI